MPLEARLDAPGGFHLVIIRGIEKRGILEDDEERKRFVWRVGEAVFPGCARR
jgi:putative transposase